MRRTAKAWMWGALALTVAIVAGLALNMLGRYSGVTVAREDPAVLSAMLEPHLKERRPPGAGPFPTALLFSGCDGVRDNLTRWAEALQARGWASIIVDSHTPRGFTGLQIWRLICAGQVFQGAERAGDVAAGIALARDRSYVDPTQIVLMGASHGGWAILEFLSMAGHGQLPLILTDWPDALQPDPLAGMTSAVLLYPYCGPLNRAARRGLTGDIPVLFLLVENDAIASEEDCLTLAEREGDLGQPVETEIFTGVTHGFDQRDKAPFSPLIYDAEATALAIDRAVFFVQAASERR